MRRLRTSLLFAALTMCTITGGVAVAGPASAGVDSATSNVFGVSLDEFLGHYPDARPLGSGGYQLEPGVRLLPPGTRAAAGVAEWPSGCADGMFCVYQHAGFGGWVVSYGSCQRISIPGNAASSMHNAQNGASARFWDIRPHPDLQGALGANQYLRDLSQDTAPDGGSWNDRIDEIQARVC